MPDIVSRRKRSQMMAGIRGKDTKPELTMRKALHSKGFRYRLHDTRLPGKPDIVLPRYNAVVQINGCFWHGHDCHLFKWPTTRLEFWRRKIMRNRQNDFDNVRLLQRAGWRVLIVWECALKGKQKLSLNDVAATASLWLLNGSGHYSIQGMNIEDEAVSK